MMGASKKNQSTTFFKNYLKILFDELYYPIFHNVPKIENSKFEEII